MNRKTNVRTRRLTGTAQRVWIWLAVISMTVYILWRAICTIPDRHVYGTLAFVCGIFLLAAESISALEALMHYTDMHNMRLPEKPELPESWYPEVDVFIATHDESVSLLYKTVNGCKHMHYPDKNKVHIFLCDDGNRPAVAQLAKELGVGYFGLAENRDAKAGNLNNALSQTHSPCVATFDADMIPTSDFLLETVPYLFLPRMKKDEDGHWVPRTEDEIDPDFKIGFIQSPQSFYNPDLFQYYLYSENRIPNEQDYFFREINVGRNRANAPIYAGSNTVISRQALEAVGGIATGSITEDFETGIRIQAAGYTCYAIDRVLAHGLAPRDFESLLRQRERWGRGCISSLRHTHLIFNRGLKLRAKLAYLSAFLYWFTFLRRFVYILAPILFVVFHIPVMVCGLRSLLIFWLPSFLLYNHALKVSSGKIRSYRWSNIIDTILFPYLILPILAEFLFIRLKTFHVTSKEVTEGSTPYLLGLPHLILLMFDLLAVVLCTWELLTARNYGAVVVLYWLLVNGFNLLMALLFVAGRRNRRSEERFRVTLPVQVESCGRALDGQTMDISENGLAVVLPDPVYLPDDEPVSVTITDRGSTARLRCLAASVSQARGGWRYGLRVHDTEDRETYDQIVYDRHHSMSDIMQPTVSTFSDLSVNIRGRLGRERQSLRKQPRIPIGEQFPMEGGGSVMVENMNYKYVRLSGAVDLPDELTLRVFAHPVALRRSSIRPGLYEIVNREELLRSQDFLDRLCQYTRGEVPVNR